MRKAGIRCLVFSSSATVYCDPTSVPVAEDFPISTRWTGVRDYIHVMDLARGHHSAVKALVAWQGGRPLTVNLGTGRGYSVLEMIRAFEHASGRPVPYEIKGRRPGDIAACYADPILAEKLLGWKTQFGIEKMCEDTWRWQTNNPEGYV